jgi:hypothetical protein
MGGKESQVGPGRFAGEAREVIHHHYNTLPSGEMSDNDIEDAEKKK